jgi:hypothetical protein
MPKEMGVMGQAISVPSSTVARGVLSMERRGRSRCGFQRGAAGLAMR